MDDNNGNVLASKYLNVKATAIPGTDCKYDPQENATPKGTIIQNIYGGQCGNHGIHCKKNKIIKRNVVECRKVEFLVLPN